MEHIWVEAASDYHPSQGSRNINADSWIQLDPSYKQYEHLAGLDVASITGFDGDALATDFLASGTVNEQEGWISGFDPAILQTAQANAQTVLQDHITTNLPNATVSDVIGGKQIIEQTAPGLPSSLPNAIKVKGASYASIPNALQASVTITLGRDSLNQPTGQITLPWASVNNHKLTLSYQPASAEDEATLQSYLPEGEITDISQLTDSLPGYLINVIPQPKLDGEIISQGQALALGEELNLEYIMSLPTHGSRSFSSPVVAGSYQVLMTVGGSVSSDKLLQVEAKATETKEKIESGDLEQLNSLDREALVGDVFYAGSLGYFTQYSSITHIAGQQRGLHQGILPSMGTYGYVLKVNYLFGVPRAIQTGGVEMDLKNLATFTGTNSGERKKLIDFVMNTGVLSSVLEHATPEQMLNANQPEPQQAISAVKALGIATQQGQRIYQISESNKATALPQIHHDVATMNEIESALATGKMVITHTDSVSVSGWNGAGYIIFDPETGEGAYKISGGTNGAYFVGIILGMLLSLYLFMLVIMLMAFGAGAALTGPAAGPALILAALALIGAMIVTASIFITGALINDPIARGCFVQGVSDGILAAGFILGGITLAADVILSFLPGQWPTTERPICLAG